MVSCGKIQDKKSPFNSLFTLFKTLVSDIRMVDLIVDTFSLGSFHSYRQPQQRINESIYIITRSIETSKDCKIIKNRRNFTIYLS